MKNKTTVAISLAIFLVLIVGNVSAALPDPSANFEMDFSQLNLPEGNWNLYFISTDVYSSNEYFELYIENYISVKQACGTGNHDIWTRYNPTEEEIEEIKQHHPVVVIGPKKGVFYKFFTDEESKGKYSKCFNDGGFREYHYDKSYELENEYGEDAPVFRPTTCEIRDNKCIFGIREDSNRKDFFIVLEKMDSTGDVYFSSPININWEAQGNVLWDIFPDDPHPLTINQLEFSGPNTLVVGFEGANTVEPLPIKPTDSFPTLYYWIIGIVVILIIIISLIYLKKKK